MKSLAAFRDRGRTEIVLVVGALERSRVPALGSSSSAMLDSRQTTSVKNKQSPTFFLVLINYLEIRY